MRKHPRASSITGGKAANPPGTVTTINTEKRHCPKWLTCLMRKKSNYETTESESSNPNRKDEKNMYGKSSVARAN